MVEIKSISDYKKFVNFQFELYSNNPFWVPPIINEEVYTINPNKNPVYNNSIAKFFLAYKNGKIVGRIAAIINWLEVKKINKKKVRFGWFDFIDDLSVSKALLNTVEAFGKQKGLKTIEGPMGFSNLDKSGMLIQGFNEMSTMITLYNHPYYPKHLKLHGYKKEAVWIEYEIKIASSENAPKKIKKFSNLILERYNLRPLNFNKKKEILPYVDQMFKLLDSTYNSLQTYVPIQDYQIKYYKEKYLKYISPDLIKCVVNKEDDLIGFVIIMPSFAKALRKANGKLFPFGFLHILKASFYYDKASFYLIGIRPDFQNKGITAILFNEIQKTFNKRNISIVETNPELEENIAIHNNWKNYQNRIHKRRATFSKKL
ncbi:MAG: GTP cyclohydrolase [Flavobacteriaceae bacterium]|nr:GTP cyclohydrolase [Flavobacteriaceae bacterium]